VNLAHVSAWTTNYIDSYWCWIGTSNLGEITDLILRPHDVRNYEVQVSVTCTCVYIGVAL
jgi:hypothetical protein